jgi:transposase
LKSVFVRREMPRVRRLGHIHQLSNFERGRIVGLREAGFSVREIARRTGRSVRTILRCYQAVNTGLGAPDVVGLQQRIKIAA